jgi:Ca-activated chloride channel family protein
VLPPAALTETYFKHYGINPTIDTAEEAYSSFALDVDTASYSLARAALVRGELPDESAIRVEEFLNAFDYDYDDPTPRDGDFSITTEVVPSPHRPGYHVLQVGIRAREIAGEDRAPANLVFVVDVSSSMALEARLGLVQDALGAMVPRLGVRDRIAIVSYGETAEVVLAPVQGDRHDVIKNAIAGLEPGGSTDVDAGLRLGYEIAAKGFIDRGINRVLLFSDGVVTSGPDAAEDLLAHVSQHSARGITISTLGVGFENYDDVLLEQLANRGNGNYEYIDRLAEAERVLVRNLTGTLQIVARDAKVQVEFDPAIVARYRLLGYENRGLSNDAFAGNSTDAGEIGPGHRSTALYEIQLRDELAPFGRVRLRYLMPHTGVAQAREAPLRPPAMLPVDARGSASMRIALLVSTFAEKLRGSYWVRDVAWSDLDPLVAALSPDLLERPEVDEVVRLIAIAAKIDRRTPLPDREFAGSAFDLNRLPVLR